MSFPRRCCSQDKRSVRRASGLVLTGLPEKWIFHKFGCTGVRARFEEVAAEIINRKSRKTPVSYSLHTNAVRVLGKRREIVDIRGKSGSAGLC
jgi:hypothetical protein